MAEAVEGGRGGAVIAQLRAALEEEKRALLAQVRAQGAGGRRCYCQTRLRWARGGRSESMHEEAVVGLPNLRHGSNAADIKTGWSVRTASRMTASAPPGQWAPPSWATMPVRSVDVEVRRGEELLEKHELKGLSISILGRQPGMSHILVEDDTVSRQHAALVHCKEELFVLDLKSAKGVSVRCALHAAAQQLQLGHPT